VPFQSGIDIVLVDVTVLGRGGAPVTALEPADFTLAVDGRPRRIHSVRLIAPAGRWRGPQPERPARRRLRCRPKPAASSS